MEVNVWQTKPSLTSINLATRNPALGRFFMIESTSPCVASGFAMALGGLKDAFFRFRA